jgi:hypothetical protein
VIERVKFDIVFSALILAFVIPAWVPIAWHPELWPKLKRPVGAVTLSALLQLVFINLVQIGPLTLDYSLWFAAVGGPCCVLALTLGVNVKSSVGSPAAFGIILASGLGFAMWFFMITAH